MLHPSVHFDLSLQCILQHSHVVLMYPKHILLLFTPFMHNSLFCATLHFSAHLVIEFTTSISSPASQVQKPRRDGFVSILFDLHACVTVHSMAWLFFDYCTNSFKCRLWIISLLVKNLLSFFTQCILCSVVFIIYLPFFPYNISAQCISRCMTSITVHIQPSIGNHNASFYMNNSFLPLLCGTQPIFSSCNFHSSNKTLNYSLYFVPINLIDIAIVV